MQSACIRVGFRFVGCRCGFLFRTVRKQVTVIGSGIHRHFSLTRTHGKSAETELVQQIRAKIRLNGPITVAEYMKEVLTNPTAGYYMHRDVFGSHGDFTTSPEISQMFGELLGIWCINEWMQCGAPPGVKVVELGPGRGTLADDMLRVFSKFDKFRDVSLHLVEVSPKLSEMQQEKLSGMPVNMATPAAGASELEEPAESGAGSYYRRCKSRHGPEVFWHHQLRDVPHGFTLYIAHEFFDALPIHKFQKKDDSWREVLVDCDDSTDGEHHLRLVLSRAPTAASKVLLEVDPEDPRDHIELCPDAGVLVQEISRRIHNHGGGALIADYGHSGEKTDTFRAFRKHALHDPLCEPGQADLTADVDFNYLTKMAGIHVLTFGPITQEKFLHNMGIGVRLQVLLGNASTEQRKNLITGYDMLTNPNKMGERFKFFALLQHQSDEYTPAGFVTPK